MRVYGCPSPTYPHSAGVVVHDGNGRLLLGLQRDGWSSFAGKGETGETPRQTALREFGEETLFLFGDDRLDVSHTPLTVSTTPRGRTFYLYDAVTRHDPGLAQTFDALRSSKRYHEWKGCRETEKIGWFPVHTLSTLRLRPSFRQDLAGIVAALQLKLS